MSKPIHIRRHRRTVCARAVRPEIIYDKSKQILASLATPIYLLLHDLSNYLTLKQIDINNSIRGCLAAVSVSVMKDNRYSLSPMVYLHI